MSENPSNSPNHRQALIERLFIYQWGIVLVLAVVSGVGYFSNWDGFFIPTLLVGGLGGSIAMVNRIRSNDSEYMKNVFPSHITSFMPILYGGLMAGIVYLLFASGILSGNDTGVLIGSELFPAFNLDQETGLPPGDGDSEIASVKSFYEMRPAGIDNAAKLLVWALLAGYSENFIVGILKQLETKISKDPKSKT